jgi:hypothetical protein
MHPEKEDRRGQNIFLILLVAVLLIGVGFYLSFPLSDLFG